MMLEAAIVRAKAKGACVEELEISSSCKTWDEVFSCYEAMGWCAWYFDNINLPKELEPSWLQFVSKRNDILREYRKWGGSMRADQFHEETWKAFEEFAAAALDFLQAPTASREHAN